MFNEDFYIDYITYYIGSVGGVQFQSVAWISNNLDYIIIDGEDKRPPTTDPYYLMPQCAAFELENIYKSFNTDESTYPYSKEWNEAFAGNGLFSYFFVNNSNYPYPENWNEQVDYQNIQTYFFIQNQFPFPVAWNEPFDPDGIYSPFTVNTIPFHGYPTPKYTEPVYILPQGWVGVAAQSIDKQFEVQGSKEFNSVEELANELKTQKEHLLVKDRDENWELYNSQLDNYWIRPKEVN